MLYIPFIRTCSPKNKMGPQSSGKIAKRAHFKEERHRHSDKRHNKLDHKLARLEARKNRKHRKLQRFASNHTCLGEISPQQRCVKKAEYRRRAKKDRKYKKMKKKLSKIQNWLKEKTKKRPRVRFSKNIYLRKHRHGQYITKQKGRA